MPASATVLTDGLGAGASFIQNSVTINNWRNRRIRNCTTNSG
ncbi:hypothetical protein [Bacillus paranthracis]